MFSETELIAALVAATTPPATAYLVAAEHITVPTTVGGNVVVADIPRGATLPSDVPDLYIQALLACGQITAQA